MVFQNNPLLDNIIISIIIVAFIIFIIFMIKNIFKMYKNTFYFRFYHYLSDESQAALRINKDKSIATVKEALKHLEIFFDDNNDKKIAQIIFDALIYGLEKKREILIERSGKKIEDEIERKELQMELKDLAEFVQQAKWFAESKDLFFSYKPL